MQSLGELLRNARWYQEFTSFGSPIDLTTDAAGPADNSNARGIHIVAGSGTIVTRMGVDSRDITLTVTVGADFPGDFRTIQSVSGVTRVLVWW